MIEFLQSVFSPENPSLNKKFTGSDYMHVSLHKRVSPIIPGVERQDKKDASPYGGQASSFLSQWGPGYI